MLPRSFLLVIDPWNEVAAPMDVPETQAIGGSLSMIRRWARATETHVLIVAHPSKQRRGVVPLRYDRATGRYSEAETAYATFSGAVRGSA